MKNLLHFEFYKLARARTLYICGIVAAALVLLNAAVIAGMQSLSSALGEPDLMTMLLGNLDGWQFMGGIRDGLEMPFGMSFASAGTIENGELVMLLPVFLAIFACGDRSSNTLKNICARGYGRTPVFFSKYLSSMVGSAGLFLVAALMSLLFGGVFWGYGPENGCLTAVLIQLIVFLGFTTFCYAIAMMIGRIGLAIVALIIGPKVLSILLVFIDTLLIKTSTPCADHWFDAFFRTAQTPGASGDRIVTALVFSILYGGLALAGSWLINRKRQI